MKILQVILLVTLVFNFSGCSIFWCPEPEIITKYKYINKPIPKIQNKPKAEKYKVIGVKLNNKEYYCTDRINASILSNNWIEYREWSESNYNLLKSLEGK